MSASAPTVVDPPPATARGLGRPFRFQLTASGLANLGDGLLAVLVPLVTLQLTTSPTVLSLVAAATWLPWLLCGIPAGVLVDRMDRRTAQMIALSVRAVLLAGGATAALLGLLTVPLLVGLVLLYGITEVVTDLSASAIVPDLVGTDRLAAANGRIIGVQQVANNFLGAPLAGLLILAGAAAGLGVAAVLALVAALVLLGVRGSFRPVEQAAVPGQKTDRVREGLRFLLHHRVLRPLTVSSALFNLASSAYFAVFVLWAVSGPDSGMHLTPSAYALLMVGFAAGAVAGSLLAERFRTIFGEVPAMVGTITINVCLLAVPVLWPNGWITAASLVVVGLLNTVGNVISQSLRQRLVPQRLLGRVTGAGRTLSYGSMPLGALLGGVVAQTWGLPTTFWGAIALSLLVCAYLASRVRPRDIAAAEITGHR